MNHEEELQQARADAALYRERWEEAKARSDAAQQELRKCRERWTEANQRADVWSEKALVSGEECKRLKTQCEELKTALGALLRALL